MRVNRLDLNLLVALDIMLKERSVTRAADQLCLSQGATSNALRRLRETFEDPLLISTGREMVPTAFALEIADEVADIVTRARRMAAMRSHFDPMTSTRHFVIMLSDYVASLMMSDVTRRLATEAPGMVIEMIPLSDNLAASLERGEADLIIVPTLAMPEGYPRELLFSDEPVVIAWTDNDQVGETLTAQVFQEAEHASYRPKFARFGAPYFEEAIKVSVYTSSYTLLPSLVVGTKRLAIIHRRAAETALAQYPLRVFSLPERLESVHEYMFWHPTRGEDAARHWLRQILKDAGASLGGSTPQKEP